ncbi:MAG: 50S ribosomal protein L17 [Elusimicrobiales bacterium]|nr:50S ribosomal protein L17 [Elusimicrobiales bacterium]
MIKNLGRKKLSKTGSHRKAMYTNMTQSLIMSEKIKTTLPKAKELRGFVERIITDAKKGRKLEVRRIIRDRAAFDKMFDIIAPRYKERSGGFTRIIKIGFRKGDDAEIAMIKLVD